MKKTLFSVMLFIVLLFSGLIANAQIYNTNDSLRVHNFLIQSSIVSGISNGEQLDIAFNSNNPDTWAGFTWVADILTGKMRLSTIDIANKSLAGSLNLKDCDYIIGINCSGNFISLLTIDESKDIIMLNCSNNRIESLDLSGFTKLEYLYCDNNRLSYLDIHNSNNLYLFTAQNNNLSFTRLKMPTNQAVINKSGWAIGNQKTFIPDDVVKQGSIYYCEGMLVDFSTLKGGNYIWKVMPNIPLVAGTDYIMEGTNNDIFIFNENRVDNVVYCTITNPTTHYNMVMETVPFKLSHNFNGNDISKLRYFLEQYSVEAGVKNGVRVNSAYNVDDPRSYGVTWQAVLNSNNEYEMRCVSIDTFDFKGLSGYLDVSGMSELEQLVVKGNAIKDIKFGGNSNLYYLDCSHNELSELKISELTELLTLICNDNVIDELDASNNKKITYINSNNNTLLAINLGNLNKLEELYCKNNKLSAIDISGLKNIIRLYLDSNNIEELNLNSFTRLEIFSANYNLLKELNLSNCENLLNIFVNNNKLSKLDLTGLLNIERLDCSNNKLDFNKIKLPVFPLNSFYSYLHPQDVIGKDKFKLYNGEYYTKDAFIDLSGYVYPKDITYFNLYIIDAHGIKHNNGSNLDGKFYVNDIIEGQRIIIETNCSAFPGLTLTTPIFIAKYEYDENDVVKLRTFLNQYSKFGNDKNGLTNGIILNPNYDANVPETYPVVWKRINGIYCLTDIDWKDNSNLKGELDLSNCKTLLTLNIACESNLERNDIILLNVNECIALEYIFGAYCQLETLNINNCSALKYLDCSHNKIESDIKILSNNITHIILTNNKIKSLEATSLATLSNLYVGFNHLEKLNVTGDNYLVELECNDNAISDLKIGEVSTLLYVNFTNNKVKEINFNSNMKLRELYCNNNQLTKIIVDNCIELSALQCANNKLEVLDLIKIPYLYQLETENNSLNFRTLQYKEIPNEISLHPQAILYPKGIDENHILRSDVLVLQDYVVENDTIMKAVLRYASNNDLVDNSLYTFKDNILSHFSNELADRTLYCEMTHSHYPGLILRTTTFNTIRPMIYNANEVAALRHFLNQISKIEGLTNGLYLSENYNSEAPETFPGVEWLPIDPEFHVAKIKWNDKPNLKGDINLNYLYLMDTLQINGLDTQKTAVNSIVIDYCYALKEIQLQNNLLSGVKLDRCKELETVNLSNNNLISLNLTELDAISRLDVSNNALTFTTFTLTHRPANIAWYPQKEIIPTDLTYTATGYVLKKNRIDMGEFGGNVNYDWHFSGDNDDFELIKVAFTEIFGFSDKANHRTAYCILTSKDNLKQGLTLQTTEFYIDFDVNILENLNAGYNVYPNPTADFVNINVSDDLLGRWLDVNLIGINGEVITSIYQGIYTDLLTTYLDNISAGVYFIQIIADDKQVLLPINISR